MLSFQEQELYISIYTLTRSTLGFINSPYQYCHAARFAPEASRDFARCFTLALHFGALV